MRFTTFNVFWLGTPETTRIRRGADDEAALVEVFRRLDADAFVVQEVVDLHLLEELLRRAGAPAGRDYTARDPEGRFLTTGRMRSRVPHIQKIALAYDRRALELVEQPRPFNDRNWPGPRAPVCARFRSVPSGPRGSTPPTDAGATGGECTLVGVHLKSGDPGEPGDAPASIVRASECAALATWLLGASRHEAGRGGPPTECVVLAGDLNAVREHPSLHPLARLSPGWTWHQPVFDPDAPHEHWTSYGNRSIIDHVLTSPEASRRVRHPPRVYAFDRDPAFDRERGPEGEATWLRRRTDLVVQLDDESPPQVVENLFRISDHRPLSIDLA